jgi:hypothetical protein
MKKILLAILLVLFTVSSATADVTLSGVGVGTAAPPGPFCSSSTTCPKNDCSKMCEDFEGTASCDSGYTSNCRITWDSIFTFPTENFQYATSPAPLAGNYSLILNTSGTDTLRSPVFTTSTSLYGYIKVNIGTLAVASWETRGFVQFAIVDTYYISFGLYGYGASARAYAYCGGATSYNTTGTIGISAGNTYHIWFKYIKGSSNDSVCEVDWYNDAGKTSPVTNGKVTTTDGNVYQDITRVFLRPWDGEIDNVIFDNLKIHTSEIGPQ